MIKRIISVIMAVTLLSVLFSGCNRNKELNIAFPVLENVRTLDPQYTTSSTAQTIAVNCFEGLIGVDENGEYIPAAAESWQKSGNLYTFYLRNHAKWYLSPTAKDGMKDKLPENFEPAVTAHDFVFAFRRIADPATKAPSAYLFTAIKNFSEALEGKVPYSAIGVTAVSDTILQIELGRDDPNFLDKLLSPAAMPCNEEFFNACEGRYGLMTKYIMTNGPFYFSRWNTDASIRITKNSEYTGTRKAKPATVWFYINTDPEQMNRKLADAVYTAGNTCEASFDLSALNKNLTAEAVEDTMYSLIFNCKSTAASVKSMRTALLYSVNRTYFESPAQTLTDGILPASVQTNGVNDKLLPQFSESAAKASLTAALSEMNTDSAQITILCSAEFEATLKQQMQQWQKTLGVAVSVKIRAMPESELLAAVKDGNFEAAFYPLKTESTDLTDFLAGFSGNAAKNPTNFSSAEYDALLAAVGNAKTQAEQTAACNDALKYLADSSVYYPVYRRSSYFVRKTDVTGIYRYGKENMIYFSQATD